MAAGCLLDQLENETRLLAAWEQVYDSATDDGPPTEEVQLFADHAATRISELARALASRTWQPAPVVTCRYRRPMVESASSPFRRSRIEWSSAPCCRCWTH